MMRSRPRPASPDAGEDLRWMRRALAAAARAAARGEVPVGAVLVLPSGSFASAGNRTIAGPDPSAHAEIVVLRRAATRLGNHRLSGSTLYVTLEPCLMCLGAIVQARVDRVVYGASDPKTGAMALAAEREISRRLNHRFAVTGGVLAPEAGGMLKAFFRARRRGSPA